MESVRSAAGRRNAREVRKHKQAAAVSLLLPALALFAYMPIVWHSETSCLTWLDRWLEKTVSLLTSFAPAGVVKKQTSFNHTMTTNNFCYWDSFDLFIMQNCIDDNGLFYSLETNVDLNVCSPDSKIKGTFVASLHSDWEYLGSMKPICMNLLSWFPSLDHFI
jgi:hypothetical protein